eukprot:403367134
METQSQNMSSVKKNKLTQYITTNIQNTLSQSKQQLENTQEYSQQNSQQFNEIYENKNLLSSKNNINSQTSQSPRIHSQLQSNKKLSQNGQISQTTQKQQQTEKLNSTRQQLTTNAFISHNSNISSAISNSIENKFKPIRQMSQDSKFTSNLNNNGKNKSRNTSQNKGITSNSFISRTLQNTKQPEIIPKQALYKDSILSNLKSGKKKQNSQSRNKELGQGGNNIGTLSSMRNNPQFSTQQEIIQKDRELQGLNNLNDYSDDENNEDQIMLRNSLQIQQQISTGKQSSQRESHESSQIANKIDQNLMEILEKAIDSADFFNRSQQKIEEDHQIQVIRSVNETFDNKDPQQQNYDRRRSTSKFNYPMVERSNFSDKEQRNYSNSRYHPTGIQQNQHLSFIEQNAADQSIDFNPIEIQENQNLNQFSNQYILSKQDSLNNVEIQGAFGINQSQNIYNQSQQNQGIGSIENLRTTILNSSETSINCSRDDKIALKDSNSRKCDRLLNEVKNLQLSLNQSPYQDSFQSAKPNSTFTTINHANMKKIIKSMSSEQQDLVDQLLKQLSQEQSMRLKSEEQHSQMIESLEENQRKVEMQLKQVKNKMSTHQLQSQISLNGNNANSSGILMGQSSSGIIVQVRDSQNSFVGNHRSPDSSLRIRDREDKEFSLL